MSWSQAFILMLASSCVWATVVLILKFENNQLRARLREAENRLIAYEHRGIV